MDRKGKSETPATTRRDRFIETARKLGADEDEEAFKDKLGVIARQKPKDGKLAVRGGQQASDAKGVPVTKLPARKAKGALSATDWAVSRAGMRDKAQRVGDNKKKATKRLTTPVAPGTKR